MSAEVVETVLYMAVCFRCNVDSEPGQDEALASEWAANHDAEHHNENDRTDADYDHYKESLRDQQ